MLAEALELPYALHITQNAPSPPLRRNKVNRFAEPGADFGYPFCWTEFGLPDGVGGGKGTVWAWPSFMNDGTHTDAWCRANTSPPEVSLQAHSAPLGIAFFEHKTSWPVGCSGALGSQYDGDAFVAYHGSWNRDPPTGYKVTRPG